MHIAPLVVSVICAVTAATAQSPTNRSQDEAAVKELVARYNAARDQEQADAIRSLFTRDADQLVSSGEWRKGQDQLVEGMLRSSRQNPGARTLTVETVRFLSADIAIADARYVIAAASTRQMWSTFVAVRTPQGWRLSAIRNMLPAR
jgi:uncharacterized protein (TIGR02246 family)